jgi:hypothetical protein
MTHAVHQLAERGAGFGDKVVPGMTQVVEVHVGEAGRGDSGEPDPVAEGAVAEQLSLRAREEQAIRAGLGVSFQVVLEAGQNR